ncbi:hypothetical protein BVC80_289g12 [Macleaya cordata]|uniref:Nuclease associated modular domain-containing protein n=1 Tax=Macleaya cordata TaxID=56857 RepID=A0A200QS14_MACCD|nr:hypothetical protein BVC80_289g12 [Macleaya cordata]
MVDGEHLQPTAMQSNSHTSFVKNTYHSFTIPNSLLRVHCTGTLQFFVNVGDSSQAGEHLKQQVSKVSFRDQTFSKEIQVDSSPESSETFDNEDRKETERRRKIAVANKGKTPWNKGRKHSAETREKIKRRTIEALSDPKVRKKMSERPRAHSEENKVKISLAQKRVWRKRLRLIRLKEEFYMKWAESIAEAARRGGCDQQELDWDSHEKIKAEMVLQKLQRAADKAREKEIAKLRKARAAKEKEEKMARIAQRRKEREEKAKARGEIKRKTRRKSIEEKQQLAISKGLKLKEKLTKIRRKKTVDGKINSQLVTATGNQPAIEKLDLEVIEREKLRKEVSLADQIRAVKKIREEFTSKEALTTLSSNFPVEEIIEQLVCQYSQHKV